ncbi:hypothetical protein RM572_22415 [Streptomyces sp. DSM 42041]|uniref:Class IIb bacteriocin, lactobin A/cerein 7B family n=1 Tax=Streptomyces hazeniae TaxID=3075538 RepID=A0ABU2NYB9_9ACTN|nr:hypothetical protein [Streptomyces sp. DSM 42041]MDT0381517.1 hypothetical protein [Streptomyces sp. DSM 42041]
MSRIKNSVIAVTPEKLQDGATTELGAMAPVQATPGFVAFGVGFAGGAGAAWVTVQAYEAGANN